MVGTLRTYKNLPVKQIHLDPKQPRSGYAVEGDRNRLRQSIKSIGIQNPLLVMENDPGTYMIIDGHRRFLCAKELGAEELPCIVLDKLHKSELETVRYEVQNNRRAWRPIERATALERIRSAHSFGTVKQLADFVHLSETTVAQVMLLREQNVTHLELWHEYKLSEAFQHAMTRLLPKLRRVGGIETEEVMVRILEKIRSGTIANAKELTALGSVFTRFSQFEAQLSSFLNKPAMKVRELTRQTLISGFTLHVEQVYEFTQRRLIARKQFSESELRSLRELCVLLEKVVQE